MQREQAISKQTFQKAAEALHGKWWQTRLSEELDVTRRNIIQMANGDRGISDATVTKLIGLLRKRAVAASEVLAKLETDLEKARLAAAKAAAKAVATKAAKKGSASAHVSQ